MSEALSAKKRVAPYYGPGLLTIRCAAIRKGGLIFSMPRPARHHDLIEAMVSAGVPAPIGPAQGFEQGFVDANGTYKNRLQAAALVGKSQTTLLYSEDLW